jgi:hypothetical protein
MALAEADMSTTSGQRLITWADPGLLTGLAWYDLDRDVFGSGQYNYYDLRRKLDHLEESAPRGMALGYERFITTSGGARRSTPEHAHRAQQVLDDFAREKMVPVLKPQPSSARTLGQAVYLRRLGWHKPGKGHANDAAQHVLAHLLKMYPVPNSVREKLFPGYTPRDTLAP